MPPTRREQLELDELLSDIYKGIETLPDGGRGLETRGTTRTGAKYWTRSDPVRQYELDASSPLVAQHRHELGRAESAQYSQQQNQKSFLTNTVNAPQQAANLSTGKRRVRIAEQPAEANHEPRHYQSARSGGNFDTNYVKCNDYDSDTGGDVASAQLQDKQPRKTLVRYANENKLIYHDEDNAQQSQQQQEFGDNRADSVASDDIDGVTRVEFYRTSWLDRQLGRASRRRSSKDLNERQAKEKAMIEELKRNLKNGAISLRQSFKGLSGSNNKHKEQHNQSNHKQQQQTLQHYPVTKSANDDQHLNKHKPKQAKIFGSGLATIPRQYRANKNSTTNTNTVIYNHSELFPTRNEQQQQQHLNSSNNPHSNYATAGTIGRSNNHKQQKESTMRQPPAEHQLIQSHYRGNLRNYSTIHAPSSVNQSSPSPQAKQQYNTLSPHPSYNNNQNYEQNSSNTLSSIPSAAKVVQAALERTPSQSSMQTLNKTISLLPASPTPVDPSSPCSPVAGGRVSASPMPPQAPTMKQAASVHYADTSRQRLTGTRVLSPSGASNHQQQQQNQYQQQQTYANPHTALMQHKATEQHRSTGNSSAREFNELDNLLKSLHPGGSQAHVSPARGSAPAQPSFGFGSADQRCNRQQQQGVYSHVQKQQQQHQQYPSTAITNINNIHNSPQHYGSNPIKQHQQPIQAAGFTVDVTDNDTLDSHRQRQKNFASDVEQQTELLPSMEDYQNIAKLNPVKNHFWYKPAMSRTRAIDLLKDKPQGTFIVRDSTSFKGAFGLAVKVSKLPQNVLQNAYLRNLQDPSADLIRHFLIEPTTNGVHLKGYSNEPVFANLPALIYQHSLTELALPCKLVIPRADIEDSQFIQKQRQFYNEFIASKEQAKHQIYGATSPNGGYRRYPGDVYVHNEHRIIFE